MMTELDSGWSNSRKNSIITEKNGGSPQITNLSDLIRYNEVISGNEHLDTKITGVSINSRTIKQGEAFLCIQGVGVDRHDFASSAAKNGASCIIASRELPEIKGIPVIIVNDTNALYPLIFQRLFHYDGISPKLLAVTGTDGKTSVATILQQLLGVNTCGYIGTNGANFGTPETDNYISFDSMNTTPAPEELYRDFAEFRKAGAKVIAFEASSEAEAFGRLDALEIDAIGLTNITREHLNTHGTLENYVQAKTDIFLKRLKPEGIAVLNADDPHSASIAKALYNANQEKVLHRKVITYGKGENCALQIVNFEVGVNGTKINFIYREPGKRTQNFWINSPLLGDFNVENLACALLLGLASGADLPNTDLLSMTKELPNLNIPGRLDMLNLGQDFRVMIDYAHTPNGIERLLNFAKTLPDVNRKIVVIGQAGERDKDKRPIVGNICTENADFCIFTEEDPKNEHVADIIADIVREIPSHRNNYEIQENRKLAIERAFEIAEPHDLVMILGKGSEDFMKVGNIKVPYSDAEVAQRLLAFSQRPV